MKKSIVISSHFIFWFIILVSSLVTPIIVRFLSSNEFGKIIPFTKFLSPIYFYIGYFGIMQLIKKRGFIIYASLGVIISYVALFLISKKAFAFGIAPLPSLFLWIVIGCLFKFFIDWFQKRNENILLEKQNMESKLALLRTQINPHFLFNTLHNIDALISENQEIASQSLIKLSKIMRYMMHDSKPEIVSLKKEIEHIENYIGLESLRLKNSQFLSLDVTGDYNNLQIAPLLFIPFVENAFKHCVNSNIENGIVIEFTVKGKNVKFKCENIFDATEVDKDKTHGIGLNTVQNRLELLYPLKHKLNITKTERIFSVNLEIVLDDN